VPVNFFLQNSRFLSTNTNCLEKKTAGFISDAAATIIVKIMRQKNLKKAK
jgi:hypothetical protein